MKISDFKMEIRNVAGPSEPEKLDEFQQGSRGNLWGKGSYGGKYYQVKIHAAEPKWNLADQRIREKKSELKAIGSSDPDAKTRLENEIATLEKNREKQNKRDKDADDYVESKKRLIAKINGAGSKYLVCPADFWAEPVERKQNATFSVEAVPWIEQNVGFDCSRPIDFHRDLSLDEQYDVVASLCHELATLHKVGVIHSDLKLGNTVVTKDSSGFKCSIIDFDSAILLEDLYSRRYNVNVWYYVVGGTFFSPEIYPLFDICREERDAEAFAEFDMREVTEKSDIFSLGITIYEYFYGEADGANVMPFLSSDGEKLDSPLYGMAVKQGYSPCLSDSVPDLLYGAINWAVALDPADRPSAEQLAKVFATKDVSLIPAKYCRNPLWEEHIGKYELTLPDNIAVKKAANLRYRVQKGGATVSRSIDDLVREGLAVRIGEDGTPVVENKKEVVTNLLWESDGDGRLPDCVKRATMVGKYAVSCNGIIRGGYTYDRLVAEGYICSEAQKLTPWPLDGSLKFVGTRPISRDFSQGKGSGNYLVGVGVSAVKYTKQGLIDKGLASTTIFFKLCDSDSVDYVPVFEKIPSTVKAITRSSIVNHQYRLEYVDGRIEKLMIGDMLAKGYVAKR